MITNLDNIGGGGGGGYVLPVATANRLGGVKVGSGLTIDATGVLSTSGGTGGVEIPHANLAHLGTEDDPFTQDDYGALQDLVDALSGYTSENMPLAYIDIYDDGSLSYRLNLTNSDTLSGDFVYVGQGGWTARIWVPFADVTESYGEEQNISGGGTEYTDVTLFLTESGHTQDIIDLYEDFDAMLSGETYNFGISILANGTGETTYTTWDFQRKFNRGPIGVLVFVGEGIFGPAYIEIQSNGTITQPISFNGPSWDNEAKRIYYYKADAEPVYSGIEEGSFVIDTDLNGLQHNTPAYPCAHLAYNWYHYDDGFPDNLPYNVSDWGKGIDWNCWWINRGINAGEVIPTGQTIYANFKLGVGMYASPFELEVNGNNYVIKPWTTGHIERSYKASGSDSYSDPGGMDFYDSTPQTWGDLTLVYDDTKDNPLAITSAYPMKMSRAYHDDYYAFSVGATRSPNLNPWWFHIYKNGDGQLSAYWV